jgi:hypothetical protein
MYKEKIVDVTTGEETWRDYTQQEITEVQNAQIAIEVQLTAHSKLLADREAAHAKLSALGLTTDDLKALGL